MNDVHERTSLNIELVFVVYFFPSSKKNSFD